MNHQKVAVVAGASSGIGLATVTHLLGNGWRVAGLSRRLIQLADPNFLWVGTDLRIAASVAKAVKAATGKWERIDAVVHSIGDIYEQIPAGEMRWDRWQRTLSVCLETAVNLVNETIVEVRGQRGAYIFVSSIASEKPYPGIADYCAAKAALDSFACSLATDEAANGIRVNSVSPAVVNTPLFGRSPYSKQEADAWHPLGRVGEPGEIAAMIAFLAERTGDWITGQRFIADGGMLLR